MNQPPKRKIDLRPDQIGFYEFAMPRTATLCGAGMGGGKSAMAIAMLDNWDCHKTLILCPPTVRAVWRGQLRKHCARDILATILDSGSVRRRTALADEAYRSERPAVIVINYEAAQYEPMRSWILSRFWECIILDESHKCMGETKTSNFCDELREIAGRRLALTGTAITQDPGTIWAQARFIDPTVFGHDHAAFRDQFVNKYAVGLRKGMAKVNTHWMNPGIDWPLPHTPIRYPDWALCGTRNTEEYLRRLRHLVYRVEPKLNLPTKTIERRTFKLGPYARSLYQTIQNGFEPYIHNGLWPILRSSFSIVMRLQQITSGWLPRPNDRDVIDTVDLNKANLLRDILREAGQPVVVFARFVRDLDTVETMAKRLGLRYGEISQRRKDGLSQFGTMPDDLDVVAVQEQAGGAGIDLTRAAIAVNYSLAWSRADADQALARIYRPPQDRPVTIYELVAEDSIDEELYMALDARNTIIRQTWDAFAQVSA